jgi:hypothetical protein
MVVSDKSGHGEPHEFWCVRGPRPRVREPTRAPVTDWCGRRMSRQTCLGVLGRGSVSIVCPDGGHDGAAAAPGRRGHSGCSGTTYPQCCRIKQIRSAPPGRDHWFWCKQIGKDRNLLQWTEIPTSDRSAHSISIVATARRARPVLPRYKHQKQRIRTHTRYAQALTLRLPCRTHDACSFCTT